jgi:RNA polymerase sigma factor (sigma-70 family)
MPRVTAGPLLQLIRHAVEGQRAGQLPDRELLRRFAGARDQAAFCALLRRHGPMVLEVCRGVLGNEADAEDAFQATFLVLVQKSGSVRKAASLGSWLHGVAYRTALKARARSAARRVHERRGPVGPASEADDRTWHEARQVLHEELGGLPERYRAPLVHCYLQGKTQDEAAALLGVSRATLKKRAERGRALLRARLVRRGLGPAAVLAAPAWPTAPASAGLPGALVSSTARAAALWAAGHAVPAALLSPAAAALANEAMTPVSLTKLKLAAAVLLLVGVLGVVIRGSAPPPHAPAPVPGRGRQPKAPPGGRIWLLEGRSAVASLRPDGSDRRTLLAGQGMLRWVSPAAKVVWFDGKDGRPPDPIPAPRPDGNPDRAGLTLHVRPLADKTADARQRREIGRLLADLGSERFSVREKASRGLADFGELAGPQLRRALAGAPPPEVRRRLERLLRRLAARARNLGIPSEDYTFFARDGRTLLTRGFATRRSALVDAVTGERSPFTLPPGFEWAVDLAPDRSWVLALETKNGPRLHKVPLRGGTPVLLTGRLYTSLGRISPDGRRVLVTAYEKAASEVYVIEVATRKATKIPVPAGARRVWSWGEWSPDGRHLVCAWGERFGGGKTRVAVCDPGGREAHLILTAENCVLPIAWR